MSLTPEQVEKFREDGVLVAEDLLTEGDLAPVIAEYSEWIDTRAQDLAAQGKTPEILFWVGCAGAFDDRYKRTAWPYGSGVWGKKEWVCPGVRDENVVSMDEGGTNIFWAGQKQG